VLTTCATPDEAESLAALLVEQRLAACVTTMPKVTSTYRWQNAVQHEQESLLVIKTTEARFAALEQAIRARSSYELPEVLGIPVHEGSTPYLEWLHAAVTDVEE
jgi:periplasmic divalent cation tolerance protein